MESREQLIARHKSELDQLEQQEAILATLPKDIQYEIDTSIGLVTTQTKEHLRLVQELSDPALPLFEINACNYVTLSDIQAGKVHVRPDSLDISKNHGSVVLSRWVDGTHSIWWRGSDLTYRIHVKPDDLPAKLVGGLRTDKWIPGSIPCSVSTRGSGTIGVLFRCTPLELFQELSAVDLR